MKTGSESVDLFDGGQTRLLTNPKALGLCLAVYGLCGSISGSHGSQQAMPEKTVILKRSECDVSKAECAIPAFEYWLRENTLVYASRNLELQCVPRGQVDLKATFRANIAKKFVENRFAFPEWISSKETNGVVWSGGSGALTLEILAKKAAPILWFSPDEQLERTETKPPNPHPCDDGNRILDRVGYYQVANARGKDGDRLSLLEPKSLLIDVATSLQIKYFFYYKEDYGLNPHRHDLEAVVVHLVLERIPQNQHQSLLLQRKGDTHRVRITRVEGLAHGVDWYSNKLRVDFDPNDPEEKIRLPIALLVEEGKHASCPDRNGDGEFMPGYDVNEHVNDAWGVRDALGSGWLGSPGYRASMTKGRHEEDQVHPLKDVDELCAAPDRKFYELRYAPAVIPLTCDQRLSQVPTTDVVEQVERLLEHKHGPGKHCRTARLQAYRDNKNLIDFMDKHGFGEKRNKPNESRLRHLNRQMSAAFRYDEGVGFTMSGFGIDLGQGWLVPKVNFVVLDRVTNVFDSGLLEKVRSPRNISVEALYTPSASRWFDWYAAVGAEAVKTESLARRPTVTEAVSIPDSDFKLNASLEVGMKFRFAVPNGLRLLLSDFGGLRLGVRASGFNELDRTRIVFEFGRGTW